MFIVLLCVWQLQMGQEGKGKHSEITVIIAIAGLVVAMAALYNNSPGGFVVKVYPNAQLDLCLENGGVVIDQSSGIVPDTSHPGRTGFYLTFTHNTEDAKVEFVENISVTNINNLKPYRDQVTLIVENGPPGVNVAFTNSSIKADIRDNSKAMGIPPFNTQITIKVMRNTTIAVGTHYLTIRGIGQDGKTESTCTFILKVNKNCKYMPVFLS